MDTEEMYERGTADAYRGEANPFYYQHYEPYRRAYNLTRRRVNKTGALPVVDVRRFGLNLAFVIAIVLVGLIIYWFATREIITPNKTKPTPVILPTLPAANVLVFATSTPVPPTPEPLILSKGGRARIQNTGATPLRVRVSPSKGAQVVGYVREGEEVQIVEGPIIEDGLVWWNIAGNDGSGWCAQNDGQGIEWLVPVP
jgi:hypothetical protein